MAAGLSVKAAYTYSRSIDNTPQELETNSGAPPNGRNFNAWFGPSDFDVPHRISISYVYELPFGHGKQFLAQAEIEAGRHASNHACARTRSAKSRCTKSRCPAR